MAVHSFKMVQTIPVSIAKAWDFFSSPSNLQVITPPQMGFRIISRYEGAKIYPGQIIEYKVKPLCNIPLYWMTEITHVQEKLFFVDEQRFGPYRMWHHQHHFREVEGGVEMTDIVYYKIPGWWIGDLVNTLYIKNKLKQLFDYRFRKIDELFGKKQ